jgi:AAA domain
MRDADPDADAIAATKAIREGMAEQEQVEAADRVPIDLSLGEDYESHRPYDDHVEPPGITEDDYFALPPEERMEVPRDAQGRPIGYWSWSKEAWEKYHRENPRQTEYEPPHKRHHNWHGEGENGEAGHAEDTSPKDDPQAPFVQKYKNLAVFISEYQPISYTIEGILPSSVFYFLTARRSTGKTAFLVAALFAIILGNTELLSVRVKKGRVAYIALENPTDLRMKLEVARFHFGGGVSLDDLADQVTIIDARLPVAEIVAQLNTAAKKLGHFQAVLWDTFQAGFMGEEFNDNAEILKYAQQLRLLTDLPGRPSVLVAAHPTKNAGESELIPYGGGSSINEADGNLTLWAEDGSIKLHFNRVRGPEFEPIYFRIEKLSSPDILDDEGRQILLPVLRPISEQSFEQRQAKGASDLDLLKSLAEEPGLTERERALKLGVPKTTLHRRLEALVKRKFAEHGADDRYRLTPKGRKEILSVV